jgi:formylglycine-generating enzyme required for sulfatase activity
LPACRGCPILTLKLDAAWVVLSACNSAAGYDVGTEAASGLARAFFYAGTRAVLATNWPVNSASARVLVSDLFERQATNPKLSRAEALREAMVAMIDTGVFVDSTGKPAYSYAHPMFWAAYSLFGDGAGSAFRECDKCPEMVVVSTGSFTMGSPDTEAERAPNEGPQHDVVFTRPFAVGKFHVTVDQFASFVNETGYTVADICWTLEGGKREERSGRSWRNPWFPQTGQHPAVCLSWNDAQAYVEWLRRKTGKNYRLLTEAEWEYAARG